MKKLLRFLLIAAVVTAIVWATREQMLPKPAPPDHHPPPFRKPSAPKAATETAPAPEPVTTDAPVADDLQRVKGIGPVYEGKLHNLGIATFAELVSADSEKVAADLDVQVAAVVDWKTQASEFLT